MLGEIGTTQPEYLPVVADWLEKVVSIQDTSLDNERYWIPPIGVEEFVESKNYLDASGILWPEVMRELIEINSGKYMTCVLTGGIGVAKTTIALYSQAYQLYKLSCLRDPHDEYDLDPASEIMTVFQSVTASLAKAVDYARFRAMIEKAPYFSRNFNFDRGRESEMRFPHRIVVKPVSGTDTAALGQNVIGGIIDEVNFQAVVENSKTNRDGTVYDQAVQNYNTMARRRESRFMVKGVLPGMLAIVSSRNYPGELTDVIETEARTNKTIYVYDKRLWQLRPERFLGPKFRVFIGDDSRKPRVLEEADEVPIEDDVLVLEVPVEYKATFDANIQKALRDIAGVATQAMFPFMVKTEAVASCFGTVQSIASREDCDFKATRIKFYPLRVIRPQEPRWAHIDLAISKDSAGLAMGFVPAFVHQQRGQHIETLPIIQFDMVLEIKPPRGGEIEYEEIRRLLYTIRDVLKINLKYVTFDQFQSQDSMQILRRERFVADYLSMDVNTLAYDLAKQAFYDGRIKAPAHPRAQKEFTSLEIDVKKNKVDHPPTGSKDCSDAMAGVVCGLSRQREIWVRNNISLHRMPASLSGDKEREAKKDEARSYMNRVRKARGVMEITDD